MENPWTDKEFARLYAERSAHGEHELGINFPSIRRMLPGSVTTVLDFGCGPGYYTNLLSKYYPSVEGCDDSKANIEIAQGKYLDIYFFQWDGLCELGVSYDLILAKLVLQYVDDLDVVARNLAGALHPGSHLILSVPNPVVTLARAGGKNYLYTREFHEQIGDYNLFASSYHRPFSSWIKPFLSNGLVLTMLDEPDERRLNICLTA